MDVPVPRREHVADVTVIAAVYGERYLDYRGQWLSMLAALDPAPAEVILIVDPSLLPPVADWPVTILTDGSRNVAPMYARGFDLARTEWVSVMTMDDEYVPDAFAHLEHAGDADIVGFTIRTHSGLVAASSLHHTTTAHNAVASHSPFRRRLALDLGGWPAIYWHDWAFWLLAKRAGATCYTAPGVHVLYDDATPGRLTTTAPPGADAELATYIEEH